MKKLIITSNEQALIAMKLCLDKYNQTPLASDKAISPETFNQLNFYYTFLNDALTKKANALKERGNQVRITGPLFDTARAYTRDFIMGFQAACDRGEPGFNKTQRALFSLPVSSKQTPNMYSDTQLQLWGKRVMEGETRRIDMGATPMALPTLASVSAKWNAWDAQYKILMRCNDAYLTHQDVVKNNKAKIYRFVTRVWKEIEAFYSQDLSAGSRRTKGRLWGIKYVTSGTSVTANGLALENSINLIPVLEGLNYTPKTKLKIKNTSEILSGVVLEFYFSALPDQPPINSQKVTLAPGQSITIELEKIGFSPANMIGNVRNISNMPGIYTVSGRVV